MPPKAATSGLMAKYGQKLATIAEQNKDAPIDYGFQPLPPGINGIAQLYECGFAQVEQGKQNAGEFYFFARGTVIEPKHAPNGEVVEGRQTSIMRMVCETKNSRNETISMDENVKWIQNEMKKLGGEEFDVLDLEEAAAQLKEAQPYFRFRTTESKPLPGKEPRTFENWNGSKGLEDYVPGESGADAVDDGTGGEATMTEAPVKAPPKAAPKPATKAPTKPETTASKAAAKTPAKAPVPPPPPPVEEPVEYSDDEDLDSLVERANAQDEEAASRLTELAIAAGNDEDLVKNTQTWEEVRLLFEGIVEAEEGGESDESMGPQKGEIWSYYPIDPATKKPGTKKVNVEILSVNEEKQTVDLRNVATKATVKNVAIARLEPTS